MQSNLLALLIAAILVSPAPRAPAAAGEPVLASAAAHESDMALRKYQLEKSRCRAVAGASEAACVRLARQQYRAERGDAEPSPQGESPRPR